VVYVDDNEEEVEDEEAAADEAAVQTDTAWADAGSLQTDAAWADAGSLQTDATVEGEAGVEVVEAVASSVVDGADTIDLTLSTEHISL
jgi:hypothetical protein